MENTSLYHSGVKGMRWGVRKYQNKDGSLTPAGKKRYAKAGASNSKGAAKNKPKAVVKAKAKTTETKPKELTPEEKKAKVLASRSAKEVYENRHLFDLKEMENTYKLLDYDKKVKDMIVHEPNKIEKFFDNTIIPWTKRIDSLVTPVTNTIDKLGKLEEKLDPEAKANKKAIAEAAKKKTQAEAAAAKATEEKTRAEAAVAKATEEKTRAETREAEAKARTAEAEAKRAESRGKFYRSIKKTGDSATKDSTPDTTSSESETKTDAPSKTGSAAAKTYKAVFGKYYTSTKKTSATDDDSVSGDWLGREKSTDTSSGTSTSKKKTTYYDVDYEDNSPRNYPAIDVNKLFSGSLAPSKQTTALVSSSSSTSVASLPAPSSQAQSFVAGLLPGPTDKE